MKIEYLRRLGQNGAGTVVETDDESAEWLIDKGHAKKVSDTKSDNTATDSDSGNEHPRSRTPGRPRKAGAK